MAILTNGSTAPRGPLGTLSVAQILERSQVANEPAWLTEMRGAAWSAFQQMEAPKWRRTRLDDLHLETLELAAHPHAPELLGADKAVEQGVIFVPLRDALATHADLIGSKMGQGVAPLTNRYSALRAALWQNGTFLYVPRNVELEAPLHIRYTLPVGEQAHFPYTLVVVEANARISLIEEYISVESAMTTLTGATTELFIGAGAAIRYASIQQQSRTAYHIGGQVITLDRDASGEWVSFGLGSKVQHIEAEARMQGDGSRIEWHGATFATEQQNLVIVPWLRHIGTATESHLDFKTVVADEGYSVFDGMIKIERDSHATSTRLEEHAIHLTPNSRSDSIPGLMIDTNDVAKAGHASTSGQVDEEQIFYMQARGINPADAKRLIVMGFFEAALNAIPHEITREQVAAHIEGRI